jgi:hypothetical protein
MVLHQSLSRISVDYVTDSTAFLPESAPGFTRRWKTPSDSSDMADLSEMSDLSDESSDPTLEEAS